MATLHMRLPRRWLSDSRVAAIRFSADAFSIDFGLCFAIEPTATGAARCFCPRLEFWFRLFRMWPVLDW